jgi:hypothetical protein
LFNDYGGKEELGMALLADRVTEAEAEFEAAYSSEIELEEQLFSLVAMQLHHLAPTRSWMGEVLEAGLSPLRAAADADCGFRSRHI